MTRVTVSRLIAAPADVVFRAVSDIERLPETSPDYLAVEFLSDTRSGVGTRFNVTMKSGKKERVYEQEVTEYVGAHGVGRGRHGMGHPVHRRPRRGRCPADIDHGRPRTRLHVEAPQSAHEGPVPKRDGQVPGGRRRVLRVEVVLSGVLGSCC